MIFLQFRHAFAQQVHEKKLSTINHQGNEGQIQIIKSPFLLRLLLYEYNTSTGEVETIEIIYALDILILQNINLKILYGFSIQILDI